MAKDHPLHQYQETLSSSIVVNGSAGIPTLKQGVGISESGIEPEQIKRVQTLKVVVDFLSIGPKYIEFDFLW